MKNYKAVISYVGTRYKGWQGQKDTDMTIQGKVTAVLEALAGHEVDVIGSGRTDVGVHAMGQVASFRLDPGRKITPEEIRDYLNRYLPEDIAVLSVEEADDRFHSRFSCVSKTYRYRIYTSPVPNVFERKYVYTYTEHKLDVVRMRQAASLMVGEHDFASFCGNPHMKKTTVRNVMSIEINETPDEIIMDFTGDGFLQNMVRIMAGTLIEVGNGSRVWSDITGVIEARNRERAGFTAPPKGLTLMKVNY